MDNLLTVAFEAQNAELNHHRRYQITVGRDLLDDWTVLICYGRLGQGGQMKRFASSHDDLVKAIIRDRLLRRLSAPRRDRVLLSADRFEFPRPASMPRPGCPVRSWRGSSVSHGSQVPIRCGVTYDGAAPPVTGMRLELRMFSDRFMLAVNVWTQRSDFEMMLTQKKTAPLRFLDSHRPKLSLQHHGATMNRSALRNKPTIFVRISTQWAFGLIQPRQVACWSRP